MARDVLKIAAGELGTTERLANSNNVKYNTWFYGREVRDTADTKYPWCMAFVQWCFNQAGRKLPYHTASCSALLNWYRQNRPECIVTAPRPWYGKGESFCNIVPGQPRESTPSQNAGHAQYQTSFRQKICSIRLRRK